MASYEITRGGANYVGYDYKSLTVSSEKTSLFLDAYECFGWKADEPAPSRRIGSTTTLTLRRDRKILNKAELTRLQHHFEACMDEIAHLEGSKTRVATIYSLTVGLVGTAFVAGSVFAVTNEPPLILLCIILAIPGLIDWALAYPLFKNAVSRQAKKVAPFIEEKYDEAHTICEKGSILLH